MNLYKFLSLLLDKDDDVDKFIFNYKKYLVKSILFCAKNILKFKINFSQFTLSNNGL